MLSPGTGDCSMRLADSLGKAWSRSTREDILPPRVTDYGKIGVYTVWTVLCLRNCSETMAGKRANLELQEEEIFERCKGRGSSAFIPARSGIQNTRLYSQVKPGPESGLPRMSLLPCCEWQPDITTCQSSASSYSGVSPSSFTPAKGPLRYVGLD